MDSKPRVLKSFEESGVEIGPLNADLHSVLDQGLPTAQL